MNFLLWGGEIQACFPQAGDTVKDENGTAACALADEYQLTNGDCIPHDCWHVHTDFSDNPGFKPYVLGVHDESTLHVHDMHST